MNKRWLQFLLVTLIIYLIFLPKLTRQSRNKRKEQAAQEEILPPGKDGAGSLSDRGTTATLLSAEKKAPTKPLPDRETPPEDTVKETIIPVETGTYYVELTNLGGRPATWDFIHSNSSDGDDASTHAIPLIQYLGEDRYRELPLEVDFREYNSRYAFGHLNNTIFDHKIKTLPNGDIEVLFTSPPMEGIFITKKYVFHKKSHMTDLTVTLHNTTQSDIRINEEGRGLGLSWGPGLGRLFDVNDTYEKRYTRSVYLLEGGKTEDFKPSEKSHEASGDILWAGQNTRFFLAALIPLEEKAAHFKSVVKTKNLMDSDGEKRDFSIQPATMTLWLDKTSLPAGSSRSFPFKIFVGPRKYSLLKESGHELSEAMFYTHMGWLRALCILLLYILHWLQRLVHNYGLAIIGLTIVVRILTYPLTHKGMKLQAKAMAEQAKIRPYIEELNEKYKDNPTLKNKKLMELYKEHGINPLGFVRGCLPLLVQMPIFISLYFLLSESFELSGAGFLWIRDLSSQDKLFTFGSAIPLLGEYFNLLPVLMGASQIIVSRFTTTASADPNQRSMMYFFPIFFMFIVYKLSSGLVLYWLVSNILQAGQQLIINKHMKKEQAAAGGKS